MSTYEKALEIATKAHKNQKRWDGTPYINHLIAVSELVELNNIQTDSDITVNSYLKIVSLLHDIIEDTNITKEDLEQAGFNSLIVICVVNLTKLESEEYFDYINRILASDNITIKVKIADLKHNLSNIEKSSLKDKYRLALYILEHTSILRGY